MPQFVFSLARVLEYRRLEERWTLREVERIAAEIRELESEVAGIEASAEVAVARAAQDVAARLTLLDHLRSLDDARRILRERRQETDRLLASAREEWIVRRTDRRAMEELEKRERERWAIEEARREQNELDEWAVLRRVA